jgi:hypothetical protein
MGDLEAKQIRIGIIGGSSIGKVWKYFNNKYYNQTL